METGFAIRNNNLGYIEKVLHDVTENTKISVYMHIYDAVKFFLKQGAANIDDGHGNTPLYFAAEKGYHNIVELLLDNGQILMKFQ